jgi:hypothetical protein
VTKPSVVRPLAALAIALVAIVTAIKLVLRVPGIPYNVSELFVDDGSLSALGFFALGVLWIGAGAMILAVALAHSRRPYAILPVAVVAISLISKALISRGATYESLDDILGTSNLFGLVTRQAIWGQWWRSTFVWLGADVVDFVERRVRYSALYSIPLVTIAFGLLPHALRSGARRLRMLSVPWALTIGVAVLWLSMCGTVVLTWAATDNLTELIAEKGPLGIPGPLFLFGVLAVAAANTGLLVGAAAASVRWPAAILASLAGIALTWLLLNAGLEQHVSKYSTVFSSAQFLLGPDRQHGLTMAALFARWASVYVGGIGVTAFGAWVADALAAAARTTWGRSAAPEAS